MKNSQLTKIHRGPILNGKQVDIKSIQLGDVNPRDRPDYSDAFIEEASYVDGTPLTPEECEDLSQQDAVLINTLANGG